jgi:hypothetical protein
MEGVSSDLAIFLEEINLLDLSSALVRCDWRWTPMLRVEIGHGIGYTDIGTR